MSMSNSDARKRAAEQAGSTPDGREVLTDQIACIVLDHAWDYDTNECTCGVTGHPAPWHHVAQRIVAALAEHDAQVRRDTAEKIAQAIEAQRIVCPIHKMPDCSPMLTGCSLVIRLHARAEVDASIARQSVEGGGER